uniref:Uncharacterized protein n=1 Tax=Solanum lycopersicum TaxID=4081 RepID=K4AWL8_SOLLC
MFYSSVLFRGSKFIFNLIQSIAKNGAPFSHVMYTIIMELVGLVDKIIELPGLPPLSPIDFPSFAFDKVESSNWAVKSIKRQIEMLISEENPRVLVNTFDALESDALRILRHVIMVEIGPSIPSIFIEDNTF